MSMALGLKWATCLAHIHIKACGHWATITHLVDNTGNIWVEYESLVGTILLWAPIKLRRKKGIALRKQPKCLSFWSNHYKDWRSWSDPDTLRQMNHHDIRPAVQYSRLAKLHENLDKSQNTLQGHGHSFVDNHQASNKQYQDSTSYSPQVYLATISLISPNTVAWLTVHSYLPLRRSPLGSPWQQYLGISTI